MIVKLLSFIATLAFTTSIAFSLYFSQLIVKDNTIFQSNQTLFTNYHFQQQTLLSQFLSQSQIQTSDFPDLQPINQTINLSL